MGLACTFSLRSPAAVDNTLLSRAAWLRPEEGKLLGSAAGLLDTVAKADVALWRDLSAATLGALVLVAGAELRAKL